MKNILCFGDSNTWGYHPGTKGRYAPHIRWTGVMASLLGGEYHVIEDGLAGRTTVLDDPYRDYCNGRKALSYSLLSHRPLDLIILMLGSNDLKYVSAEQASQGIEVLLKILTHANETYPRSSPIFPNEPKILLASPLSILPEVVSQTLLDGKHEQSLLLPQKYAALSKLYGIDFLAAGDFACASPVDGIHMSEQSHLALGKAFAAKVLEIFSDN